MDGQRQRGLFRVLNDNGSITNGLDYFVFVFGYSLQQNGALSARLTPGFECFETPFSRETKPKTSTRRARDISAHGTTLIWEVIPEQR